MKFSVKLSDPSVDLYLLEYLHFLQCEYYFTTNLWHIGYSNLFT